MKNLNRKKGGEIGSNIATPLIGLAKNKYFLEDLKKEIDRYNNSIELAKGSYIDQPDRFEDAKNAESSAVLQTLANMYIRDFLIYNLFDKIAKDINDNDDYILMEIQLSTTGTSTPDQLKNAIVFYIIDQGYRRFFSEENYQRQQPEIEKKVKTYIEGKIKDAYNKEKASEIEFCTYVLYQMNLATIGDNMTNLQEIIHLNIEKRFSEFSRGGRRICYEKRLKADLFALAKSRKNHVVQSMTKTQIISLLRK
jgi:hypothetical protein